MLNPFVGGQVWERNHARYRSCCCHVTTFAFIWGLLVACGTGLGIFQGLYNTGTQCTSAPPAPPGHVKKHHGTNYEQAANNNDIAYDTGNDKQHTHIGGGMKNEDKARVVWLHDSQTNLTYAKIDGQDHVSTMSPYVTWDVWGRQTLSSQYLWEVTCRFQVIGLAVNLADAIAIALYLYGLIKKKWFYLVPYLFQHGACIVFNVLLYLSLTVISAFVSVWWVLIVMVVLFAVTAFDIYVFVVVLRCCNYLKDYANAVTGVSIAPTQIHRAPPPVYTASAATTNTNNTTLPPGQWAMPSPWSMPGNTTTAAGYPNAPPPEPAQATAPVRHISVPAMALVPPAPVAQPTDAQQAKAAEAEAEAKTYPPPPAYSKHDQA